MRDFLFIQSTTEIGGAESVLLNVLEASEELRRRSAVVILGFGHGDLPNRLRSFGAHVIEIRGGRLRHPWGIFGTVLKLEQLASQLGTRVCIGNGTHPQVYAGLLKIVGGLVSVYYVHAIYREPLWRNHPIEILALCGRCDLALVNSKASMNAVSRLRPRLPVKLLYPGVSTIQVDENDARSRRAELRAHDGAVLFGIFGRLQHWKGQDVFVNAAAHVAQTLPEARFAIVGGSVFGLEKEYAAQLVDRIEELGLRDRFVLTGFRSDVSPLMAACDVVCHATRVPEPFGMVVVEAMAQGRPVIATRGGGPSEIIEDGTSGVLVPPDDAVALADAMLLLAADPARRRSVGEAGQLRVKKQFSSEAMATGLIEALDTLQ